jgi:hypothetical protein
MDKGVDQLLERFGSNTWKKITPKFTNLPISFTGPKLGCIHPYGRVPSCVGLFDNFWSWTLQRQIVQETNKYASKIIDDNDSST